MTKLSLIKRVINPTKRSGAKKSLLKRDGITSDGDGIPDDGSSSLSERQEKGRSKSKKKFNNARKIFRRVSSRNGVEQDGYESSSDASTGSTRSTSSSFLRFQNRSIWKAKLMKNSVLQRREDGSEMPVENETKKPWPMFDKIYKGQNQVLKKGEMGEDDEREFSDDDDDSVESGDCPLAPPAPIFIIGLETEECADKVGLDHEGESVMIEVSVGAGSSEKAVEKRTDDSQEKNINLERPTTEKSIGPKESFHGPLKSDPQSPPLDSQRVTAKENGIPASGAPKAPQAGFAVQRDKTPQPALGNSQTFPTQKLTQSSLDITSKNKKSELANAKPPRPSRKKKKNPPNEKPRDITPLSIPLTICYSLRSAIGDGSERQRNSHSLMDRRPLRPNGCSVDVSYWSHRGKRNYMEDRFVIEHMGSTSKHKENSKPMSLLAVFDGHGGSLVSQFCSDWISSYIRKKNVHFPGNLPLAMKTSFTKIDSDFVSSGYLDGTTACAVTIVGKKVICCNAGDSRAIIVKRDGTALDLSQDHKPDRNDETKRINDLGGRVIHWGRWRVEGVLAVSRSIGDAKLKPYVTAEPDVVEHDIGEDDMFLVVASDGVWDTMSSDLVAKFVLINTCKIVDKRLQVDEKKLRWIARQVSKRARENGSSDNIACIVAHLNGQCN
mmetsp:Transcript_33024/g.69508  ORF Transcript_33024/g.69508 Transcript_33024/m.69508 type:complete len:665 (+) Transcript_33024:203-2197(+)|eukprot:CAMPEP_0172315966 /NCGR_PEP_ID=MMETSP1058-20130122/26810_1 /TAXON_ID=83371 /ORGANISM="Detonula confervacea, Strain CCMP 353" /LENGTH=664 /DNA_ID=CAMNT_0013030175 /DNA_START=145 /DNA_END=2139 /DNA_ORIENTATION=-